MRSTFGFNWRRALGLLVLLAQAADCPAGPWINTQVSQIQVISTSTGDRIYIVFQPWIGSDGCTDGATYYYINPNTAQGKNLYSMALLAKQTGAGVAAFSNGCDDLGRNILGGLWLY
jgi:hypothetical protein